MKKKPLHVRISKKLNQIRIIATCQYDSFFLRKIILNRKESTKRIYLFGSPNQVNLGDQAQTYCIENWCKENYPEHELIILTYYTMTNVILSSIRKTIKKNDLIFIHSGYHITDLYTMVDKYCKVIKLFPDFNITIFPQTINFEHDKEKERFVANTFNSHGRITLLCRDNISFEKAQKIFTNCKLLLYPDIVTSLIGKFNFNNKRNGILFCMRNDKEALYSKEEIRILRDRFKPIETDITDTDSDIFYRTIQKNREKILMNKFQEFSKYKLVITDRYHGTIFSLISNTPVIVLSSTDHKLSSGVKWFPQEFNGYVTYADSLEKAYSTALEIYNNNIEKKLPTYFDDKFYKELKTKIYDKSM